MKTGGTPIVLPCELPQFAGIDDRLWKEAVAASTLIQYPLGTGLLERNSTADTFLIVLQGTLKVYETDKSGREMSLYRVHSRHICVHTLLPLLGYSNKRAQVVAERDSRVLAVPAGYFRQFLAASEGFRCYVMAAMACCIADVLQLIAQISFKPLDIRLAHSLQQLASGSAAGTLRITHQAVANEIGTTREVASRLLKSFEKAGYVKLGRGTIEVLSQGELGESRKSL